MKKCTLLALALFASLPLAASADGYEDWIIVKQAGTASWAVDAASTGEGDDGLVHVRYATWNASPDTMNGQSYNFTLAQHALDCAAGTAKFEEAYFFDNNIKPVTQMLPASSPVYPIGDKTYVPSLVRLLFNYACADSPLPDNATRIGKMDAAFAAMKAP